MTKYRESKAPITTTTYDKNLVEGETDNIYEALSIISKEIFENKEQIEVSKFYESLPKPHALAVEEWLQNRVYHRKTEQ
jgi:antitoxin component YwqK of YwqJK toxin-antitoxin module